MGYRVFFSNFGYFAEPTFASLDEAAAYSRSKCFETTISTTAGDIIASWSPIGGLRTFRW